MTVLGIGWVAGVVWAVGGCGVDACTEPEGGVVVQPGLGGQVSVELLRAVDYEGSLQDDFYASAEFYSDPEPERRLISFASRVGWADLSSSFPGLGIDECEPAVAPKGGFCEHGVGPGHLALWGPSGVVRPRSRGGCSNTASPGTGFFSSEGAYALIGFGSESVGRFAVEFSAPGDFVVTEPAAPPGTLFTAPRDEELSLRWTASGQDEFLIVELAAIEGTWRCRFRNDGAATVPVEVLSAFSGGFRLVLYTYRTFEFRPPCVESKVGGLFLVASQFGVSLE